MVIVARYNAYRDRVLIKLLFPNSIKDVSLLHLINFHFPRNERRNTATSMLSTYIFKLIQHGKEEENRVVFGNINAESNESYDKNRELLDRGLFCYICKKDK